MTDVYLLKYIMSQHGDSIDVLAKALGLHPRTLQAKLNAASTPREFTQREISIICNRYNLNGDDLMRVFFLKPDPIPPPSVPVTPPQ